MIVKRMEEGDLNQVVKIEEQLFSMPWTYDGFLSGISQDGSIFLVAISEEKVVGYLGMYCSFDEGEITNVGVQTDMWNQGIGRKLMDAALTLAKDRNIEHLILEVRKSNEQAIGLYKKTGFEEIGLRPGFYEMPREDGIVMKMNWSNWKDNIC